MECQTVYGSVRSLVAQGEIVDHISPKFDLLALLREIFSTGRRRRFLHAPSLFLLLLLGLVGGRAAAAPGADVRNAPVTSVGVGATFAIADFDGDHRPDLASVQTGRSDSSQTDYWIQLRLTAVGRQSIRLVAPAGGLQIEARDVNGDHAVDLVLSTAWRRQPVAILLNDGHGNFSRVEPTAFPGAFTEATTKWTSTFDPTTDVVGVPPQSTVGIWPEARGLPHARSQTGSIPPSNEGFLLSPFLISYAGRAPPSEFPHL